MMNEHLKSNPILNGEFVWKCDDSEKTYRLLFTGDSLSAESRFVIGILAETLCVIGDPRRPLN